MYRFFFVLIVLLACGCAPISVTDREAKSFLQGKTVKTGLPKASYDAKNIISLESNKSKTTFIVDNKEIVTAKRAKILVNDDPHEIIARPEGYFEKEQYIQPPFSESQRVSFYFLMEDKNHNYRPDYSQNTPTQSQPKNIDNIGNNNSVDSIVEVISPTTQYSQNRTALVIGNSNYSSQPLANPANDARDLADVLSTQGFTVYLYVNVNYQQMDRAVKEFGQSLGRGGVGLFYFAGHGLQVNGDNYLLPLLHGVQLERDVKYKAVNFNSVLDEMGSANNGFNVAILDACRDNPLPKSWSRSASRGLSLVKKTPTGTFVAYATEPGNVAFDGDGRNGLYTKHLIQAIQQPRKELELVFRDVLRGVKEESKGKQIPWTSSSFDGEFLFKE